MRIKVIITLSFTMLFSLSSVSEYRGEKKPLPYVKTFDPILIKEQRLKSLENENECLKHDIYLTGKAIVDK